MINIGRKNKISKTREDIIVDFIVWILLILVFFLTAYPFYYILVASFSDGNDLMRGGVYFWPRIFTTENFVRLLSQDIWINALKVSVIRTLIGTFLTVMMTSIVSYALSRENLIFGKVYRFFVTFSMYVSGGIIPFYILLRYLHLLNTIWVYVIPSMLNLFFVLVGISFFRSIPVSLIESGWLDGASEWGIFIKIVLPVSVPFIATLVLFSAVYQWNSWLDSSYYVNDEGLRTMAYRMISEINSSLGASAVAGGEIKTSSTAFATQATAMVVSMLPIMCVYPFLQKYFVQGIMLGAVKE